MEIDAAIQDERAVNLISAQVFTSVSTTVLRFFNYKEYKSVDANGRLTTLRVLQADHGISCYSPSYKTWTVYAVIMLFVYPVGIPLLYFAELWYHRKAINPDVSAGAPPAADAPADGDAPPAGLTIMTEKDVQELKIKLRSEDKSIQHLEFLFRDYEPRTYLFIVFECVRRLALTGMLIFIFPGSASQIVVGLFVAVFSQLIIAAAGLTTRTRTTRWRRSVNFRSSSCLYRVLYSSSRTYPNSRMGRATYGRDPHSPPSCY